MTELALGNDRLIAVSVIVITHYYHLFFFCTSGSLLQLLCETQNKICLIPVHYSCSSLPSDIHPISLCSSLPSPAFFIS